MVLVRLRSWLPSLLAAAIAACGASASRPVTASPPVAAPTPPADLTTPEGRMVALVNTYRAAAGVVPVVLDRELTKGCHAHAEYMRINRGKRQLYSTNAHDEDPSLPGATPEGAACGKAADLYPQVVDLEAAVRGWTATLYHRPPILASRLERVGVGWTRLSEPSEYGSGEIIVALQFVWANTASQVVVYPANGQNDVPLDFVSESPNPLPPPAVVAGFPITVQFDETEDVRGVTATLTDGAGAVVPVFVSSPEAPARKDHANAGLIGVIPRLPLRATTRYTATIHAMWNGTPKTWTTTFTTIARTVVDAMDEDALFAAAGKAVTLRGTVLHAGKPSEGNMLVLRSRGSHRLIEVGVDFARVQVGVSDDRLGVPEGATVEADGTLVVSYGKARVTVTPASPLRVVRSP